MPTEFILIAVALAVFIFFQFRSSRKRAKQAEERQATIVPGAEIMTNYGLYGTLIDLDEESNIALIETTPGTVLRIHRQTILKAVDDETPDAVAGDASDAAPEAELNTDHAIAAGEPEFGERIEPAPKKPARGSSKKAVD
ncbi:preprotein translocase subunit YajC [Parafrigoribacterium soli]|uniref:preprotein translocase subunit YajC n=1 Tax=Parafrigoribacterium soli TaxID=3144663 RepID=UPI0032EB4B43